MRTPPGDGLLQRPRPDAETGDALTPPERFREPAPAIVRQDTTIPPAGQMPVAHQAAERIIAELQSPDEAAAAERAQSARQGEAAPPAPIRTLHIQLRPPISAR